MKTSFFGWTEMKRNYSSQNLLHCLRFSYSKTLYSAPLWFPSNDILTQSLTTIAFWCTVKRINETIKPFLDNLLGIIHLVRKQNFSKNLHFLLPDTRTYVHISGGKSVSFTKNFAYVLNEWSFSTESI